MPYLIVQDLYALAKEKAKKNGVYIAVKQEPIRIWKDVKPGGVIRSVIDGFQEHAVELGNRQLAAQNVIKGEFYGIGKDVLAERYRFVRSEADYDLYEPRADQTDRVGLLRYKHLLSAVGRDRVYYHPDDKHFQSERLLRLQFHCLVGKMTVA